MYAPEDETVGNRESGRNSVRKAQDIICNVPMAVERLFKQRASYKFS